ncbi:MAG: HEAT repeat domain-containing protein [Eubacteriales bacterium]
MGLLDSLKDLFVKKDITEKIKGYAEEENTGKLVKLAANGNPMETRLAAIDALKEIKMDILCVDTLMSLLNEENKEIKLAACNSLKRVGTKREVDVLFHKAELEEDAEIAKALTAAAVEAKERTPRF